MVHICMKYILQTLQTLIHKLIWIHFHICDYIEILDEEGKVIQGIDLKEHGWGIAQVTPSSDGEHFFTANIFSGVMLKVRLDNGEVVGSIDTGFAVPKRSFAGIAEYSL